MLALKRLPEKHILIKLAAACCMLEQLHRLSSATVKRVQLMNETYQLTSTLHVYKVIDTASDANEAAEAEPGACSAA